MTMVRAATLDDAHAITDLWRICGLTRPWNDPAADVALAIHGPSSVILVVERDGVVIGSVMAGFDGHRGWVYYVAVDASARRGGIGRRLMAAAGDWLRARGAPKLQLMVRDGNAEAVAFYTALGFTVQPVTTLGRFLEPEPGSP